MTEYYTCINGKASSKPSSQYCPIDDSQDRDGTIFIPCSLAVQATREHPDF